MEVSMDPDGLEFAFVALIDAGVGDPQELVRLLRAEKGDRWVAKRMATRDDLLRVLARNLVARRRQDGMKRYARTHDLQDVASVMCAIPNADEAADTPEPEIYVPAGPNRAPVWKLFKLLTDEEHDRVAAGYRERAAQNIHYAEIHEDAAAEIRLHGVTCLADLDQAEAA